MLIFEDCANSAPSARFLPLPRRFFCVRMARALLRRPILFCARTARDASGSVFQLRRDGAVCLRRPILFCLARKEWGEKRRWTRNRADAPEKAFCFCVPFTDRAFRKERPSGGPQNFCRLKNLLRQIFLPAKSKSICSESMRGFQDLPVSASQTLLVAEDKRAKSKV